MQPTRRTSLCVSVFGITLLLFLLRMPSASAQDNYEIQVYGADTVKAGFTMLELHSNYTVHGTTMPVNGVLPTQDQIHETLETTHGFTDWFETGFYIIYKMIIGRRFKL